MAQIVDVKNNMKESEFNYWTHIYWTQGTGDNRGKKKRETFLLFRNYVIRKAERKLILIVLVVSEERRCNNDISKIDLEVPKTPFVGTALYTSVNYFLS